MPDDGEQRPSGPPDYKVYRSRKSLLSRLRSPDLSGLRERAKLPGKRPKRDPEDGRGSDRSRGKARAGVTPRKVFKWIGLAALGWILLSFLAFGVSAQIQSFKLSGEAKEALHGNPFLLPSAQTILVLGTDARPPGTGDGAAASEECFEQQSKGENPHDPCFEGEFRADTLMLIRAGGGAFRKLSIPRDVYAEIPGQAPEKINAAFSHGGAALQIKTIEDFLGIEIDHVAIVDFTGFEDLIDAVGGVTVDVPVKLCADISGGAGGGQGGQTLRLHKGENTLDGEKALIYSRIRKPSECPGTGASAYSLGYDDLDRAKAQQAVINGIKDRLTDPLRVPYNFIHGPIIGWDAPKAFVSDMGFFTMPQLVLAAGIGGSGDTEVLCGDLAKSGCTLDGPGGSIEVPEEVRRKAVNKFLNG
ncbi:MAG TPA: LCP family protein [Solirubrobacterales bacterium]|jgi:LCP family protein required for cell wall assembly|nr:LCP family protein [Solirubrobacterales bacterium]